MPPWASDLSSERTTVARVFTREEFYKLVWSKPMTHLAKEFAISDVALHKVCRKHSIPNPPLGWWAKKAAGKKVKQTRYRRRNPEPLIESLSPAPTSAVNPQPSPPCASRRASLRRKAATTMPHRRTRSSTVHSPNSGRRSRPILALSLLMAADLSSVRLHRHRLTASRSPCRASCARRREK